MTKIVIALVVIISLALFRMRWDEPDRAADLGAVGIGAAGGAI